MKSSRQVAAEALARCERGGYSQLVLDAAIRRAGLTPRDAAFSGALFYGTLERKLTLDHCLAAYAKHPLTPEVQAILRCAVYQLLYLDSVPPRAAVDEAVNLTRVMRQSSASGMVNGILRAFLRDGCAIPAAAGTPALLRVKYSCAEALIARLIDWYGVETAERILASSIGRPQVFLRVNPLKTDPQTLCERLAAEGCAASPGPFENCLTGTGDLAHTAAHAEGLFHIQDAASQLAALTLDAQEGERLLDVCAAPGSKSFVAAQQMKNRGEIVACDLAPARLRLVEQNAARLGIDILHTLENDGALETSALAARPFDRVLCDVPCSGLGVLRRKPELKYRDVKTLDGLPPLQYKILETSSHYCKENGTLVYSTCTLNPDENERIIERFLAEHPGFSPDPFDGERYFITNLPGEGESDGFFIARIRRRS